MGVCRDPVGDLEPGQTGPLRALVERGSGPESTTIASRHGVYRRRWREQRLQREYR